MIGTNPGQKLIKYNNYTRMKNILKGFRKITDKVS